jgi:phosphatidylethanolamine-binding protein (PEBP) family uncharacterized protein
VPVNTKQLVLTVHGPGCAEDPALDTTLAGKMFKDRPALEEAMKGHILAQSELMARYEKIKK